MKPSSRVIRTAIPVLAAVVVCVCLLRLASAQAQEPTTPAGGRVYAPLILHQQAPSPPAPDWLDANLRAEQGMSAATYRKLVGDASSGRFDRACAADEHDPDQWHTLLNYERQCHYNHQHGDNPFAVNDLFGQPGAWYGEDGRSVAYPWQTFPIANDEMNPNVAPAPGVQFENQSKHEGFIWFVRRNQSCSGGRYCVTDFRLQIHFHSTHDAPVRWHSYSIEARLCAEPGRASTCGTYRLGGWIDYARLFVPDGEVNCWVAFNGALEQHPDHVQHARAILQLPNYDQFYRPEADEKPFDELRCHKSIAAAQVAANPRGLASAAEWWGHSPFDFRYQVRVWNPHTDVGADAAPNDPFCSPTSSSCRWTFSRYTVELDYVVPIHSSMDRNGDGRTDLSVWVNRLGGANAACRSAGLNCIPARMDNIPVNPGGLGYNHDLAEGEPYDYDITPAGRPSWITWFHHYGH